MVQTSENVKMDFPGPNSDSNIFLPTNQPHLNLQRTLANLHNRCSNLLNNLPLLNPKTIFHDSFSSSNPVWARISQNPNLQSSALTPDKLIKLRLKGVRVYAVSPDDEKFMFISGKSSGKSLGLFCFSKEDAEAYLAEMKALDPEMEQQGYEVVSVALNKVVRMNRDDAAVRLMPEVSQLKNALEVIALQEGEKPDSGFTGVPVFQSRSLALQSNKKSYRPAFFRKEDLDLSLARTAQMQNQLNPATRPDDIEVAVFEDIIKGMKESSNSEWNDIVFVPPGYEVPTTPPKEQ